MRLQVIYIYISFIRYLKKPVCTKQTLSTEKFKIFICLLPLALFVDFGLDFFTNNHWLMNVLKISDIGAQENEFYKLGFGLAILTVGIIGPILEELIGRSYLNNFYWNNGLIPINVSIIFLILLNVKEIPIIITTVIIALFFCLIIYLGLKKSNLIKVTLLKFYSKNFTVYFYLSSISFGVIHLTNFAIGNFIPFLPIILVLSQIFAGLILGYKRLILGLRWSIAFHSLHNIIFLIPLFLKHLK